MKSVGPLQLSVGHEGGVEAAAHAMRDIYNDDETQGLLFVDAENAFNSMNRSSALHNIQHICPIVATYITNLYRKPCKLFVANGKKYPDNYIISSEGTTQGCNSASAFYSIGILPILLHLHDVCRSPQIWFADDAGAGGKLQDLVQWWDEINITGPKYGYFPKASKSWLIVKPEHLEEATKLFQGKGVNITSSGHERYLGTPIGTVEFVESLVEKKVDKWIRELRELTALAEIEPQLAYSAYIFGLSKRWMFLMRTTPHISELLKPLELVIRTEFIPSILGQPVTDEFRDVFALPTKYGGLGIFDPSAISDREYVHSRFITSPFIRAIHEQEAINTPVPDTNLDTMTVISNRIKELKKNVKHEKNEKYKSDFESCAERLSESHQSHFKDAAQKGVSSWLTCLPLEEHGFVLNKKEFSDALCLRYNFPITDIPQHCACGKDNSISHTMTCAKGGYWYLRHNKVRDLEASFLSEVCKDVVVEPRLLPLTGEVFRLKSTKTENDAHPDISARDVFRPLDKVFFDVRIFHPGAESNASSSDAFHKHEQEKKRDYNQRIIDVEKATFIPLVFATNGTMGKEADKFHKRLGSLLAKKRNISYSEAISFVRRRLRFSILRTSLISLRGFRGNAPEVPTTMVDEDIDIDLIPTMHTYF